METQPDSPSSDSSPDLADSETLWQQIAALPRPVWILAGGMFINRFGTFVVPFLTLYLGDRGFNAGEIWQVFGAMALGGIGAMFLGGWLTDRIGRKNAMAISLLSGAASMLLLWQAATLPQFLVAAFFSGLTHGMFHPAAHSLMADVLPVDRRVTGFAVVRWAVNLGFACGMAAGGLLADHNFAWLFIGDAGTSAIFGVIAFLTLPHGIRATKSESHWRPALRHMATNRRFHALFFANLLVASLFFQWGSSVARLVVDLDYPKQVYGWLMALNGILITFFEIPLSRAVRRIAPRLVIAVGFLVCGIGMSLNLFADTWVWIAIAVVVFTLGEMVSLPISSAYLVHLSPDKMRGRYAGALGLTWNLGNSIAPGLGLVLYEWHASVLWIGTLFVGVVAAIVLWRGAGEEGEV